MNSGFYRAFEDKFRGQREDIKNRLKVYLPFITVLKEVYLDATVIDLGCGRGEWLELLEENGFVAQGVDLDESMLEACRILNLNVSREDVISCLKKLPDSSRLVVSSFHLVEHISFSDLQVLVKESLRVLKDGGVLILETPNPENIIVGTSKFYLDPTHNKPIPSELLAFLVEYYGFEKVKILRLQESLSLEGNETVSLLNVLSGVSPDYAIVAQKNAAKSLLNLTKKAFDLDYGITLEQLTMTFNEQSNQVKNYSEWLKNEWERDRVRLEKSTEALAVEKNNVGELLSQLTGKEEDLIGQGEKVQIIQLELEESRLSISELRQSKQSLEDKTDQLDEELSLVYASKSWRIMLYLRQLMHALKKLFLSAINIIGCIIHKPRGVTTHDFLANIIKFILNRPQLRSKILLGLNQYPWIKIRLIAFINNNGLRSILYSPVVSTEKQVKKDSEQISRYGEEDDFQKGRIAIQKNILNRINHENKSPLEKWFY